MKKPLVPVIVVLALVVAAYFAWQYYGTDENGGDGALAGSGTIEAQQIAVTPQATGRVVEAPEEEGAPVKKGDVLYRLDDSLLKLQVDQAWAGVQAARANYAQARDDDDATDAEVDAAQAQYAQAIVAWKMAKVQVGYATIASPIDGVLSSIAVKAGENAVPGNTLAVVSDISNLTVTIYVPESRIGEVKLGQSGTLATDSTQRDYDGKVIFVASEAEFTPASVETKDQRVKLVYQVKLAITDADASLKPGMPADVTLR